MCCELQEPDSAWVTRVLPACRSTTAALHLQHAGEWLSARAALSAQQTARNLLLHPLTVCLGVNIRMPAAGTHLNRKVQPFPIVPLDEQSLAGWTGQQPRLLRMY